MSVVAALLMFQEEPEIPAAAAGLGIGVMVIGLAIALLMIAGMWKLFAKAGKPGWAAIVPIYNNMVLAEVGGKPAWWGLLMLIPFVNVVIYIILCLRVAANFGKGGGFGAGLILLPFIFFPVLGFSDAQYRPVP